jgi:ABC-type dipeptide/oligopeptide/nickel transport system ATPase component
MYILLAIATLCFFVLVLVAVAVVRHVRSRRIFAKPQPDFAHHLFAAAKDQNSRTPRTLPHQNVKDVVAKTSWNPALEPTPADTRKQSISSERF